MTTVERRTRGTRRERFFCVFCDLCVERREPAADQRRRAVAAGEDAPRGGDDVEARGEGEREQQDRQRIEKDPERKTPRVVHWAIQAPAADPRQQGQVE
jgi:hypothetical protein